MTFVTRMLGKAGSMAPSLASSVFLAAALALALPSAARAAQPVVRLAQTASTATPGAAASTEPGATTGNAAIDSGTLENPYGLDALWKGGDFIARGTLIILFIMSTGSWYVIVTKLFEQYRMNVHAREAGKTFWNADSVRQGVESLKPGSPYRFIAQEGVEATRQREGLLGRVALHDGITMSIQRAVDNIHSRAQDGLAVLATVGSTAPFVGLFGTVCGIYHALTAIGNAGQASIDKVAGPVGEALIMTAVGLAVAVPAVLGYNWLVRRNKTALEKVRSFGAELHSVLLAGASEH
jgi:biopolymer transport protein ExbB